MGSDNRVTLGEERLDFTCENKGYRTNINKGFSHGTYATTGGSRLAKALVERHLYTLWVEHVTEISTGADWLWLMWYREGKPTIPMSGVFSEDDFQLIQQMLDEDRTES